MTAALILPGIGSSGPGHWQTLWEQSHKAFVRVQQRNWDHPVRVEWQENLERSVAESGADVVLVAHSLACLLVAHWAAATALSVRGALLVAPPNPDAPGFPREAVGFSPVPLGPLPFQSILVASSDDPYASFDFSEGLAFAWGSRLVNVGPAGHINADSGLGDWPEGLAMVRQLANPG